MFAIQTDFFSTYHTSESPGKISVVRQKKVMNKIENIVQILLMPLNRSFQTNNVSATYKEEQ